MELRVLRYFLAVAREESISGAAEYLHLTQPTLSRQLMELEAELGKQLLIRGNRHITLTEEGMLLRKRATEILNLVERTQAELQESDEAIAGEIYIGGGESDAIRLLAKVAQQLQQSSPQIRYHLFSGNAEEVGERLDKGLLDFGVMIEPGDLKKYDYLKLPYTERWGVVMPKSSPLAAQEHIRPQDLWELPLLISRQEMDGGRLLHWLGKGIEDLNIVATYNLVFNASLLVDEGLGYALTLDKLVNTSQDSRLCFRPLSPALEMGLFVVWKKFQMFSKAAERFLALLRRAVEAQEALSPGQPSP